jgi:hypothetical protein
MPAVPARASSAELAYRRASARIAFCAMARVEGPVRVGTFRVADISFGGLRLVGDGHGFELGGGVYVVATDPIGVRVAAWAVVVRIRGTDIGLAWAVDDPLIGEQVARAMDQLAAPQRPRQYAHTIKRRGPTWFALATASPRRALA